MHADQVGQHLTYRYVQILYYKNGVTIAETYNNRQHIQFA